MMKRVLWIEDMARTDLMECAGFVLADGSYDLQVAMDPSETLRKLSASVYEALVVDVRLLPGDDPRWIQVFNGFEGKKHDAKLGCQLILSLLRAPSAKVQLRDDEIPPWLRPERIGFLTVEPWAELKSILEPVGIRQRFYVEKGSRNPRSVLLNLLQDLFKA